jgi:hypothetical protein
MDDISNNVDSKISTAISTSNNELNEKINDNLNLINILFSYDEENINAEISDDCNFIIDTVDGEDKYKFININNVTDRNKIFKSFDFLNGVLSSIFIKNNDKPTVEILNNNDDFDLLNIVYSYSNNFIFNCNNNFIDTIIISGCTATLNDVQFRKCIVYNGAVVNFTGNTVIKDKNNQISTDSSTSKSGIIVYDNANVNIYDYLKFDGSLQYGLRILNGSSVLLETELNLTSNPNFSGSFINLNGGKLVTNINTTLISGTNRLVGKRINMDQNSQLIYNATLFSTITSTVTDTFFDTANFTTITT